MSYPRSRFRCAAAIAFCVITLLGTAALGQGLFIYRDLNSGIYSDMDQSLSLRFMRHIWIVNNGDTVMAAVVQQGGHDGHGLALFKTLNEGGEWTFESALSSENDIVSDGVLDADNNLLLVTSLIGDTRNADVNFIKLTYQPALKGWTIDPSSPVTVYKSQNPRKATRATIAVDSNGVIWCAFRFEFVYTGVPGYVQIKVLYSVDGGSSWIDNGSRFGTFNRLAEKSAKVIAVGSRIALIYQDMQGAPPNQIRYKSWAYREDSQPLQDSWTTESIAQMVSASDDTVGSHWSVAADGSGNLHLSYQDAGIRYLKYDALTGSWRAPQLIATYDGSYNSLSVAPNNDLYLFSRFSGSKKVFCKRYASANQRWSRWIAMSSGPHDGYLRMSSPEAFTNHLPLLYETNASSPYDLLYVLFDTSTLDVCGQAP